MSKRYDCRDPQERAAVTAASIPAVRENESRQSKRTLMRLPQLTMRR